MEDGIQKATVMHAVAEFITIRKSQLENTNGSRKRFQKPGLCLSSKGTKISVKTQNVTGLISVWFHNYRWKAATGFAKAGLCQSCCSSPGESHLPKAALGSTMSIA